MNYCKTVVFVVAICFCILHLILQSPKSCMQQTNFTAISKILHAAD